MLQDWVAGGGTLIVTADIFPLDAYESFTSVYGVTGYVALSNDAVGNVVASHPITEGVGTYHFVTESTYASGPDALLLGDNGPPGEDFLAVLEPATGFLEGGRLAVFGDHNLFTDSFIADQDNTVMAGSMADWACRPLLVDGACPGVVSVQATGSGRGAILFSNAEGSDPVPGGACAGTPTGLSNPQLLVGPVKLPLAADPNVPSSGCGLFLQALELDTCELSNVETVGG